MNPFASSYSTSQPYPSAHACPKCLSSLGVADIHTLAAGEARRAFYTCPGCGFEWTQAWRSIDKGERISGDELIGVHEALADFEGRLTDLLER